MIKLFLLFALFTPSLFAANIDIQRRDVKFATQAMLEHQTITTPVIAITNRIKTTYAGPTSAAALVLSSFTAQPDVARNITITPTGTTGDVESCVITIAGTNILGAAITDTVTFAADASTIQSTTKAFLTVTSVSWPASCESGGYAATWVIGVGDVLGLKRCMDYAGNVAWASFNGAYETTRPTCIADADEVEKNTCDINGTLDGAKNVELYFVQNFRCLP
jgi:hypothetical protein